MFTNQIKTMIKYLRGPFNTEKLPKKTSTAMSANTFAARAANGLMTFASATSTEITGLLMKTITSHLFLVIKKIFL